MPTGNYPRVPLKLMSPEMLSLELGASLHSTNSAGRELIVSAMSMAAFAHEGQTRKYRDGQPRTPYIEHPLRVALRIARWGETDPNILAAALMHDIVEDSSGKINRQFGSLLDIGRAQEIANQNGIANEPKNISTLAAMSWIQNSYNSDIAAAITKVTIKPWSTKTYQEEINNLVGLDHSDPSNRAALLIKSSDMCDNAGSLLHQYGHVADSFVDRLATKYLPELPLLSSANKDLVNDPVAQNAAKQIDSIRSKLERLVLSEFGNQKQQSVQKTETAEPNDFIF